MNYLVVGPWNHGGWTRVGDSLGPISFGGDTAAFFRDAVQAPFFAFFLKDKGTRDFPEAVTFESGTNRGGGGTLAPKPPRRPPCISGGTRRFTSEAGRPVGRSAVDYDEFVPTPRIRCPIGSGPFRPALPGGSKWSTWLVGSAVQDDRPDVLSWESRPLTDDVTLAGVVAHLFASTTGTDADWIVKLIDVYPEEYPQNWNLAGYQLMVSNEVFRGRYRNGIETPTPIPAGQVQEYTFSLHTQNYTFQQGHRIMVQVQSTWFLLIDRNPQTFTKLRSARPGLRRPRTVSTFREVSPGRGFCCQVRRIW
jgi:putative CocE/NonD family hydrolase